MNTKTDIGKLERLLRKNGFQIEWKKEDDSIIVGTKVFKASSSPQDFMELPNTQGLLLNHSSKELRKTLQERNINYIDLKGYLHMNLDPSEKIVIEENSSKKKKPKGNKKVSISPTLLISPNGFALIDTLFRLNDEQLQKSPSVLQFSKLYDLYQPKISKIMTAIGAKDLVTLKQKISALPIEWWLYAFDLPVTKRKMTAFFDVAQNYYSLDGHIETMEETVLLKNLKSSLKNDISQGPTLIAKQFGELIDSDISLWASPSASSKLKKEFKLVAGTKEGHKRWVIASPSLDLTKAELISHVDDNRPLFPKTNILRSIWDLSFSESRLREIRSNLLRSFLK